MSTDILAGRVDGASPDPVAGAALAEIDDEAWDVLQHIAASLHLRDPNLPGTLEAVARTATGLIAGATAAGINLYERGRFTPQAVCGSEPPPLDALQQRTGQGPCIDASREQEVVHVRDMADEVRWPEFAELARSLGVGAMLCLPLRVDDVRLGSLSLYYAEPTDRREHDEQVARMLATQAALAIFSAQLADNLRRALINRDVIGQAKGILMERHRLTADQAFDLLTEQSQSTNRKLVAVAEDLVHTGTLPGAR